MVANSGDKLQRLIGDEFDIVGFDPRYASPAVQVPVPSDAL